MPLFDITESEIPGGRDLANKSRDKTANQSVRNPNEHDMKWSKHFYLYFWNQLGEWIRYVCNKNAVQITKPIWKKNTKK